MIVQVKLSVRKLKKLDDPEARLRRAVLINNTLLCLRRGDGEAEKGRERDMGKEVLPPSNEYRTSLEKALPGGEGPCWSRGDDRGQWTEEKDEWKMEEQVREEEQLREDEHLKEEEHFRREEQLGEEEELEDEVKVKEESSKDTEDRLRGPDCDNGVKVDMQDEHGGSERLQDKDGMMDEATEDESEEGGRTKSSFNRLSLPPCHCQYYLPSLSQSTFYGLQLSRLVCSMES